MEISMTENRNTSETLPLLVIGTGILAGLYLTSFYSFILFHVLVELFSVVISGGIFVIAWNSRRFAANGYLLAIGIAHLCVGGIDLLHTLAYKGMGLFPGFDANLPTQLWIAGRYLQSASFLLAPFFIGRRLLPHTLLAAYLAVTSLTLAAIFAWQAFPVCFVEGVGLTPFKKVSEYIISATFVAALALLRLKRRAFDRRVANYLSGALALMVGAELAFTFYIDVFGLSNLVGHLFKAAAVLLIYRGLVETALTRPYDILFRELAEREEAVRESHQRISAILESITDAFFSLDHSWCFTYLNGEAERLLGRTRGDLLGKSIWEEFADASGTRFDVEYRRAVASGATATFEEYYSPLARWFEVHAYPSRDGLSVFFQDITTRKRAEAELRASEERFAKAFNTAPTIMIIASLADGRYLEVNGAFEKALGWRKKEVLGRTSYDLGIWIDKAEREDVLREVTGQGSVHDREIVFRNRNGETIIGLYSGVIIELNGEQCLLSLVRNITARKRAEQQVVILNKELEARAEVLEETNCELEASVEQLEAVNRELEAANEELEAFNYSVSHDLRRPLTNINGFSQLILELYGGQLEDQCRDFVRSIYDETRNMDHLIGTLLNFSRITRCAMRPETVNLSTMARQIAETLRMGEPERRVSFHLTEGVTARGDAGLLHVVLDNLVGNAWKYSSKRADARIEFGVTGRSGAATYFVRDNGAGFDMELAERLFAPFQRLHHTDDFEGHGIGLATVARIVQRHGGKVWAEGEVGQGATFYFTLC